VSLDSGRNVLAASARGVDAQPVDGIPALVEALTAKRFDRVFNILHGGEGENGVLQGLLEAFGVAYTGSGVLGSALTLDKIRTKQVWLALGLATPRYVRLLPGQNVEQAAHEIGLPVIVKPSLEGSSVGVSRVFRASDLQQAIELAQLPGRAADGGSSSTATSSRWRSWARKRCPRSRSCRRAITTTITPSTSPKTRSICVPA
jgi:D-alanine-D-alanine ligase